MWFAEGLTGSGWAATAGLLGTLAVAIASLIGVIITSRKTTDVQGKVNGQLTTLLAEVRAQQERNTRLEVELALMKEREAYEHPTD